jgi:thiamine transport system ATP-binding protein
MTLVLTEISVRFGDTIAVDGITLDLPAGGVLGLLGPSGSGKSTLLRAIAGLERSTGSITWDGVALAGVPPHKRGFALMFQDGQLFPHLDVAGNIGYALRVAAEPSRDRVSELLELVGLVGFERRRVTDLSGGEQQRVALARSLAARPRLLLLDEPLSALDRELRERLGLELRDILARTGITTILVTHDHEEAALIADRIGVMDAGRLLQVGTLAELRAHPTSERVARFLGVE